MRGMLILMTISWMILQYTSRKTYKGQIMNLIKVTIARLPLRTSPLFSPRFNHDNLHRSEKLADVPKGTGTKSVSVLHAVCTGTLLT
jgi:hypothetical protein